MADREVVLNALMAQIAGMTFDAPINGQSNFVTTGRRLRLWGDVSPEEQPAAFLVERPERYQWPLAGAPVTRLDCWLIAYCRTDDRTVVGGTYLNLMVAALEAALSPDVIGSNLFTLGGLVYWCRIEGQVLKESGDIDGQAKLLAPIAVELPVSGAGGPVGPVPPSPGAFARVVNKTAGYAITPADSGSYFTNAGAGGAVAFALPPAQPGMVVGFIVRAAQDLLVGAAAGQTIAVGGVVSAAGGSVDSATPGSVICLIATDQGGWEAISSSGPWSVN